jgi:hypothetical protein
MTTARGLRGFVAGMLVIGAGTVGVAVSSASAGPGVMKPPNCEVESDGPIAVPAQVDGRGSRCATLAVTKVVTGRAAPGTTFAVVVNCVRPEIERTLPGPSEGAAAQQLPPGQSPPFTTTLTFPEGGGAQDVLVSSRADCTVTETPPPGCTLTSIDPVTTQVREDVVYPITVTNDCDPGQPPEPAAAVVEVPRFTG